MRENIIKRIDDLNEDLKVRQESIDILKGKLMNQIRNFKETIAELLDKDTSSGDFSLLLDKDTSLGDFSLFTFHSNSV